MRIPPPPSQIIVDIQTLVWQLEAFALGDPDAMTDAEVASSLALLDAALPDLIEIEVNARREKRYIAGTNSIT